MILAFVLCFGSMPGSNSKNLLDLVESVFKTAGVRGVVQIKAPGGFGKLSSHLFNAGWVDHDWLFGNSSMVICHGGISTLATAMSSGRPVIVILHAWDQNFWGGRIEDAGIGIMPF